MKSLSFTHMILTFAPFFPKKSAAVLLCFNNRKKVPPGQAVTGSNGGRRDYRGDRSRGSSGAFCMGQRGISEFYAIFQP